MGGKLIIASCKPQYLNAKIFYRFFYFTHSRTDSFPLLANCQLFMLDCRPDFVHKWRKCNVDCTKINTLAYVSFKILANFASRKTH